MIATPELREAMVEDIRYRMNDEKSNYRKAVMAVDRVLTLLEEQA